MGCCESSRPPYVPQYGGQTYGHGHGHGHHQPGYYPGQPCTQQVVQGTPVGYQTPAQPCGPAYGGACYQPGPAYQGGYGGGYNGAYASNGTGAGNGMSAGMAGLAGFAGGFLAAEIIDDMYW